MDLEKLDIDLDTMIAHLELENETCHLKHSKQDPAENHKAINYLCQRLGDQELKVAGQELRIPICKECVEALYNNNWILVYCTYCHQSQWIYRPIAKREYPEGNNIYWLYICPHCAVVEDQFDKEM